MVWNSEAGIARLESSKFKNDFYQLINFYQPQMNPIYCSAASSVAVLNALNYGKILSQKESEVQIPNEILKYNLYSQQNFFNEKTDAIKSRDIINYKATRPYGDKKIYDAGLSLAELSTILKKVYHVKNEIFYVEKNDAESQQNFRQEMKKIFHENKKFIIANFDGTTLGQPTGGHFSPLVAYDEASDSVLILDVALHKNRWFWTSTSKLYEAMNTRDVENFHGYVIVGK